MPIIPQYRAQGPAGPQAPVMEQQGGPRVDASAAVRGVAALAGVVQGVQVGQIDPNLGQQSAQGLQAIGAGVGDVGSALFDISQRVAEAKNYADEHDAQLAMDREVGEFEKWRIQNPDPTGWEPAWRERMDRFGGQYFGGKNLAPVAQEAIKQRLGTFTERRAIQVGVDAMRESVGRATSAMSAEYMRAVEAGDAEAAQMIATDGFKRGWIPEDQAERMKIQARDQVESKQIEMLQNQKDTFLLYGDEQGAIEAVQAMPIREDEKALEIASVRERAGYQITIQEVEDIIDPTERIARIEGGEFDRLRPSDKAALLNQSYQMLNAETTGTVAAMKEEIDLRGGIQPTELEGREDFKALPDREKEAIRQYLTQGAKNDIGEFTGLLNKARTYDASADPRGAERAELENLIALNFDGSRGGELLAALEESASRGGPLKASERVLSDVFTSLQKRYDAGELGGFRVTGDQISKRTDENGVEVYTVPDPNGEFEQKGFLGTYRGRVIQLSEQDRLRFEEKGKDGGQVFEDIKAKETAFSKFLDVQQEVDRKVKAGEITEADDISNEVNRLLGGEVLNSLESRLQMDGAGRTLPAIGGGVSGGLFPPADPTDTLNWLDNYNVTF